MSAPKSIADLLRREIESAPISLNALAHAIGIGQPTLWRFVHDRNDPRLALAERLMHYFGYVLVKADEAEGLRPIRPTANPQTRRGEQRARNAAAKAAKAKSSGTRRKRAAPK